MRSLSLGSRSGCYQIKRRVADHTCSWTWVCTFNENEHRAGRSGFGVVLRKGHPLFEVFEQVLDHLPFDLGDLIKATKRYRELEKTWVGDIAYMPVSDEQASNLARPFWIAVHQVVIEDWPEEDNE